MEIYDGFFQIEKEEHGIYVKVTGASGVGKPVQAADIIAELEQEGVVDVDVAAIEKELLTVDGEKTFLVKAVDNTPDAKNIREKHYRLRETADHMTLFITVYAHDPKTEAININDVINDMKRLKIVIEPDMEALKEAISGTKLNQDIPIVQGQPAVDNQPDKIEYHFKTEKDYRPEIDEQGNVNYHKLNVIANVKKGQLLATLHEGTKGRSGINILGKELKPKMPKPVKLRRGKNVAISNDQKQLFAEVDGLVKLEEGRVIVNDTYDVPNHVGSSTGDIDFQGSIVVHGNVMTGFSVKAQGDIEVLGVVEGANVEAGGNIILHRGIQGMSSCTVKAGGNLKARYIENADVVCGGNIHSEAILHSTVTAKEEIVVEGKKGMISGGTVRSGISIKSNILGSHMGTVTNVEVGIDPFIWEEYNNLLKELPKLKLEAQKLEQVIVLLNKRKELEGDLDEQKQNMYVSATRNKIFISNKISVSEKRLEILKEDVERRNDGQITVRNIVYPGTRITIGTAKTYIRDEVKYVKMYKDGADVKMTSL